jgi:hypothetical protein
MAFTLILSPRPSSAAFPGSSVDGTKDVDAGLTDLVIPATACPSFTPQPGTEADSQQFSD